MTQDKSWMDRERDSAEWQTGMKDFLNSAFDGAHPNSTVPCSCRKYLNIVQKKKRDVHSDLLYHGIVDDGAAICDMLNTLIRGTDMRSNADHDEGAGDIHVDDSSGDGRNQEPNATAKVFFELLKEAKKELYPGCDLRGCHEAIFHCETLPNQVRVRDDQ
jgi:hypothetical protein